MARVLFVNRYFHPDHSATSQILSDLAFHLAEAGFRVEVLTSRQLCDDPAQPLPREERVRGVHAHRLWSTAFGRGRLLLRAIDYLTFYLSATAKMAALADSDTIVVAETDPPLMSVPAALAARFRRAKLVNWTQDLFPEIAESLGVAGVALVSPVLRRVRNMSMQWASTNVVLGEGMAARLRAEGIGEDKIALIPNWFLPEPESVEPPGAGNPLRKEWGLEGKFVVGYSGNLGRAHDFAAVLAAATRLRARPDIAFLFIGDGAQRPWVEERGQALGLHNILFQPYQPLERLRHSLSVPHLHIVSLKPELEGLVVPSKLYAALAAGRGVLFVGSLGGEIANLIRESGCGRAFAPSADGELAAAVSDLAGDREKTADMGARARALWDSRFRRSRALARWQDLLTRVSREGGA